MFTASLAVACSILQLSKHVCQCKTAHMSAGEVHTFWNANNETAVEVEATLTPAGKSEAFFKTYCGLGHDAGSIDNVSPLQLMVSLNAADMRLAVVPRPLWLLCRFTLIPMLQHLAGYKPFYPEYVQ